MADQSQQVLEALGATLAERPDASTEDLQAIAAGIDPAVGALSRRQFNAGYVVPLKRKSGGAKKGKGKRGKKASTRRAGARKQEAPAAKERGGRGAAKSAGRGAPAGGREEIRAVLIDFAQDFSQAETRFEIVSVLSELDRYVDRIVAARG